MLLPWLLGLPADGVSFLSSEEAGEANMWKYWSDGQSIGGKTWVGNDMWPTVVLLVHEHIHIHIQCPVAEKSPWSLLRKLWCLLACLLACLPACLLACLLACLPACLLACLLACLRACLLACLLACLSSCLFVCFFLSFFLSLFLCLSVCPICCLVNSCFQSLVLKTASIELQGDFKWRLGWRFESLATDFSFCPLAHNQGAPLNLDDFPRLMEVKRIREPMQAHKGASVLQNSFLKSALQEASVSCNCRITEFSIAVECDIHGVLDGEFL